MASLETVSIAITCDDGEFLVMGFGVRQWLNGNVEWEREPTAENIEREIVAKLHTRTVVRWRFIKEPDDFPEPLDGPYRGAWVDTGKAIIHDMDKAKEIHRNRLRQQRGPLFTKLDAEFVRTLETDDIEARARIVDEKQRLRDITDHPDIEKATTIEEMRAAVRIDA